MIRHERIQYDIATIAAITSTPGKGATRPTFSPEWGRARDHVIAEAQKIGCSIRIDSAGNVFARAKAIAPGTATWLCGSHIDTVPHGGDYDGVAGIVAALELMRSATDDGVTIPLELVIFAEEEGPTFGLGMLGSRAMVGELNAEKLADLQNSAGQNYLEAGKPYGVDASRIGTDLLDAKNHFGLIELHIEQGPGMWRRDERLAVVRAIAGRRQYHVTTLGEANHAGATSMSDRRDALAGAAEMVTALESAVRQLSPDAVLTVGRLNVLPNAVNVIADRVEFTIDFRAPDDELLRRGGAMIEGIIGAIVQERGLKAEISTTESIAARPMSQRLVEALVGGNLPITVSGALHDSAVLAPYLPTVMLFVPSRDGISHNPAEFSRIEDIVEATRRMETLVRRPTLATVNAMSEKEFVALCGKFFEHSPWIAERTAAHRPFATLTDLHASMCALVDEAPESIQLALINAHPDLVGRLAREGRLTTDSTSEQKAAGLSDLSESDVADFEKYNAAYRERFGFPFVICARKHRKDAILASFPARLINTREEEIATALAEIAKIAELRLRDAIWE